MTSSGYQSNEAGVFSASANIEGPYNGTIALSQGQSTSHTLDVGGGGPTFVIPFRIETIRLSGQVRGGVAQYAASMQSNGSYTVTF